MASVDVVLDNDWKYTKQGIDSIEEHQILLKPRDHGHLGDNYWALVWFHKKLRDELGEKQFKIIAATCTQGYSMEKGLPKPH